MRTDLPDSRPWLDLRDGRRMVYGLTGPADGSPVIYCHGAIGTPIDATVDLELLTHELGIRYIAPSRPGVGGSDGHPGRSILSWAEDARQLADHLGLEEVTVIGVSAGGPYALSLAHVLGDRVRRVAAVSSLSPLCAPQATPGLARRVRYPLAVLQRHPVTVRRVGNALLPLITACPGMLTRVIAAHAAPAERERLAAVTERMASTASFLDSCRGGVGGLVEDYGIYTAPWGFEPAEVHVQVDLWHGMADPLVPIEHAYQLAAALPHCRTFFDPEEGHHFFREQLGAILGQLLAGGGPGATTRAGRGVSTTRRR